MNTLLTVISYVVAAAAGGIFVYYMRQPFEHLVQELKDDVASMKATIATLKAELGRK